MKASHQALPRFSPRVPPNTNPPLPPPPITTSAGDQPLPAVRSAGETRPSEQMKSSSLRLGRDHVEENVPPPPEKRSLVYVVVLMDFLKLLLAGAASCTRVTKCYQMCKQSPLEMNLAAGLFRCATAASTSDEPPTDGRIRMMVFQLLDQFPPLIPPAMEAKLITA